LAPAGLEKSVGIVTGSYIKDPTDPQWKDDPAMKDWVAFMRKYYPDGSLTDGINTYGYTAAQLLVQVLKQCGDDLSRENVMKQATSLKNVSLPLFLPGLQIDTSPTDFRTFRQLHLARFDGKQWVLFGDVIGN
jgi:branched-chain amino acid transport system substrate-binding protein